MAPFHQFLTNAIGEERTHTKSTCKGHDEWFNGHHQTRIWSTAHFTQMPRQVVTTQDCGGNGGRGCEYAETVTTHDHGIDQKDVPFCLGLTGQDVTRKYCKRQEREEEATQDHGGGHAGACPSMKQDKNNLGHAKGQQACDTGVEGTLGGFCALRGEPGGEKFHCERNYGVYGGTVITTGQSIRSGRIHS